MDSTMLAALIAGAAGIFGAVTGQYVGQRRAHTNAVKMFLLQATERAHIRTEESDERRETAFLAKRQEAYADLMSALYAFPDDLQERDEAVAEAKLARQRFQAGDEDAEHAVDMMSDALDAMDNFGATSERVLHAVQIVHLLAPWQIASAAMAWAQAVRSGDDDHEGKASLRFLALARTDVGADPRLSPDDAGGDEESELQPPESP